MFTEARYLTKPPVSLDVVSVDLILIGRHPVWHVAQTRGVGETPESMAA